MFGCLAPLAIHKAAIDECPQLARYCDRQQIACSSITLRVGADRKLTWNLGVSFHQLVSARVQYSSGVRAEGILREWSQS
jgi:hypothetical protein